MVEEYNEYGEIKKSNGRKLSSDQQHRIHETKDMFDMDCIYCQKAAKKMQSYWADDE